MPLLVLGCIHMLGVEHLVKLVAVQNVDILSTLAKFVAVVLDQLYCMVTMVMVLQSVGLPTGKRYFLPIDRLLDPLRTTVNVESQYDRQLGGAEVGAT